MEGTGISRGFRWVISAGAVLGMGAAVLEVWDGIMPPWVGGICVLAGGVACWLAEQA